MHVYRFKETQAILDDSTEDPAISEAGEQGGHTPRQSYSSRLLPFKWIVEESVEGIGIE